VIIRLTLLLLSALPVMVHACSVPVFRYALEHWAPDPYEALVFHRGELSSSHSALLKKLNASPANVSARAINLDDPATAEWKTVWEDLKADTLPWMIVRPNPRTGINWARISVPFDADQVAKLLDSPARREIVQRIAAGESAVWVLLEGGDPAANNEAARVLEERLKYLQSVLKLPELSEADIANGLISIGAEGLKLKFSSLRLSRGDPAEELFVRMLLDTESDLAGLDQPMVFPIYGQGRSLYTLVGKGINAETIDAAAIFLVGSCSCEVKEQNPGVDLLMSADWVGIVKQQAAATPAGAENAAAAQPEVVKFSAPEPAPPTETAAPSATKPAGLTYRRLLPLIALGVVVLLIMLRSR